MESVSSTRQGPKVLEIGNLLVHDNVMNKVKYNIHDTQNNTCLVMRYLGLLENTSGFTFICCLLIVL
jgi:hypothetical protein